MNDDELRGLIRAAIQRHVGPDAVRLKPDPTGIGELPPQPPSLSISFSQYQLQRADGDTMCIIEPAVQCNHCGFCKCHGH